MIRTGVLLGIPQRGAEYNVISKIAVECEKMGFDAIWLNDHFNETIFEIWTTLSSFAIKTKKCRLGTNVICTSHRHPSVLAKMAATLDVISDGRLDLGIGAGWVEKEHIAYGLPFGNYKERLQRLKEGIIIMKKMWTEEKSSFNGKYYIIKDAICDPKPMQKPHIPIIIGGKSDRIVKLVAEFADGWDFGDISREEYLNKLSIIEDNCSRLKRDSEEIEKFAGIELFIGKTPIQVEKKIQMFKPGETPRDEYISAFLRVVGTPDECIEKIARYIDLGITNLRLRVPDILDLESLRLFSKYVMPAFRDA
jgi:alkanesulfonate monooxygenase SsuD/methylene tetrahydromethanopterin reductase-like flavin-dependent oxidoreductase (luciferase family)